MAQYYQLEKVGRVARRTGIVSLVFAVSEVTLMALLATRVTFIELCVFAVVQILPGAIALILSGTAERGDPTAFFAIFATAVLTLLRPLIGRFHRRFYFATN